jgi:hypothetical protein
MGIQQRSDRQITGGRAGSRQGEEKSWWGTVSNIPTLYQINPGQLVLFRI